MKSKATLPPKLHALEQAMQSLVTNPELRAVAIDGPWGTGKTYFAKAWGARLGRSYNGVMRKFAYASFFGASSIDEMRTRLCLSIWANPKVGSVLKKLRLPGEIMGVDLEGLGEMAKDFTQDRLLRDLVICLDDFERRSPDIRLVDVMGFIAELIEDRACKCVVLMNAAELAEEDRAKLREYHDKVFDLEVAFDPAPAEVMPIAIPEMSTAAVAVDVFEKVGYANIRVMKRLTWVLREVETLKCPETTQLWPQIVRQASILTLLHYRYANLFGGELSKIVDWEEMGYLVQKQFAKKSDNPEPDDPAKELLLSLEYQVHPYDAALIGLLKTGRLDPSAMATGLQQALTTAQGNSAQAEYEGIWQSLKGNFRCGREELCNRLEQLLLRRGPDLSISARLSAADLLLWHRPAAAKSAKIIACIHGTIAEISKAERKTLLPSYRHLARLRGLMRIQHHAAKPRPAIESVFADVAGNPDGYEPRDMVLFAQFTPKEVADFLRAFNGRGLFSLLARLYRRLESEDEPLRTQLRATLDIAIARVEKDDPLNRYRVESLRQRIAKAKEP